MKNLQQELNLPSFWKLGLGLAIGMALFLLVAYFFCTSFDGSLWKGYRLNQGTVRGEYGERNQMDSLIRQPFNSWSNFAFLIIGIFCILVGLGDFSLKESPMPLIKRPGVSMFYGLSCLLLGVGSFLFHASLTKWAQRMDVTGMYAPLVTLIWFEISLRWLGPSKIATRISLLLSLLSLAGLSASKWWISAWVLIPVLILLLLFLWWSQRKNRRAKYFRGAFWLFFVAFILQGLDRWGIHYPFWFEGHALWHILCALSLLLVYGYCRSETQSQSEKMLLHVGGKK